MSTDSIELSKLADDSSGEKCPPPIYDLLGVVNHSGGMNGGHYIAHVDGSDDPFLASKNDVTSEKNWLCFNDCRIGGQSSVSAAGGPSAYMLFYRRRETSTLKTIQI